MDERTDKLVAAKKFEALTSTEKEWVLGAMTETEYRRLYEALQLAPKLDETVAPSPRLRASLMAQFEKPVSIPQKPQPAWYLKQVPVWQAAAVLLLLSGAIAVLSHPGRNREPVVRTRTTTDTVYVEKIVWKERVVVKTVKTKAPPAMAAVENAVIRTEVPTAGMSVAAQPELMQFFTSAGK